MIARCNYTGLVQARTGTTIKVAALLWFGAEDPLAHDRVTTADTHFWVEHDGADEALEAGSSLFKELGLELGLASQRITASNKGPTHTCGSCQVTAV